VSSGSLARAAPRASSAAPPHRTALQRHLRVPRVRGALPGRAAMRPVPAVLSSCRTRRTLSTLRRAGGPGRPPAGARLIVRSATMRPTSTLSRALWLTVPETGRGQASLWTAAAAPDHRLWTTQRGPVDPSRLPTCPLPRRLGRTSCCVSITPNKGETIYSNSWSMLPVSINTP
jgi:hypothetical protein